MEPRQLYELMYLSNMWMRITGYGTEYNRTVAFMWDLLKTQSFNIHNIPADYMHLKLEMLRIAKQEKTDNAKISDI